MISRRGFIGGVLAAPLVVNAGVLMPVKPVVSEPKKFLTPKGRFVFHGVTMQVEAQRGEWIDVQMMGGISIG